MNNEFKKSITIFGTRTATDYSIDYSSILDKLICEAEIHSNGLFSPILETFEKNFLPALSDCNIRSSQLTFGFGEFGVDNYIYAGTKYSTIWVLNFIDEGNGSIRMELRQFA